MNQILVIHCTSSYFDLFKLLKYTNINDLYLYSWSASPLSLISWGMMMMMMMNCFCGMVDRRKAFSLISSRDHCQRSSPSRISDTSQAGFEPAQNLSSGLAEWSCAVEICSTPCWHYFFFLIFFIEFHITNFQWNNLIPDSEVLFDDKFTWLSVLKWCEIFFVFGKYSINSRLRLLNICSIKAYGLIFL